MCIVYVVNECSMLEIKVIWKESFSNQLVNFTMRNVFGACYEQP